METTNNPYQTPSGRLAMDDNEFGEIRFFSPAIRIGRMRYLSHSFLMLLVGVLVVGVAVALATQVSPFFWALVVGGYLAILVFSFILMIQRLHDLNHSGWLCLIMLVPLVGTLFAFYIMLAPGTKATNNYGLQPPPNQTWNWILGLMMPVIGIIGILAAIALPAYVDYTERASGASSSASDTYYDYDDQEDDE